MSSKKPNSISKTGKTHKEGGCKIEFFENENIPESDRNFNHFENKSNIT